MSIYQGEKIVLGKLHLCYIILLTGKKMTAKSIASELEVSVRSVYRYMEQLAMYKVPVTAAKGRRGGDFIPSKHKYSTECFTLSELQSMLRYFQGKSITDTEKKLLIAKLELFCTQKEC